MNFSRWLQKQTTTITGISAGLIAIAYISQFFKLPSIIYTVAMISASIIAAVPIMYRAFSALKMKIISIELLVSIAVIGAFIIGEYNESAVVTFLFLFGSFLEQKTLEKTHQSIKQLTELAPTTAQQLLQNGEIKPVDVDDLVVGDVVQIKAGGQLPVDGEIVEGTGYVNEASVTGEARLVKKAAGDQVFAGTILDDGFLQVTTTKVGDETTFGKIIELVEEAQDTKSPAEKFIDQFAKYYTPAVLILALVVGLFTRDFKLAITVLVLGCPGALVIGAPVSNVAGIGNGAKHGVLIKGGDVMTTFAQVDTLVFDKTGTLTKGTTAVTAIKNYRVDEAQFMPYVMALETVSDHPLGRAIVAYGEQQHYQGEQAVETSQTLKGQGMQGTLEGHQVLVGNEKLLKHFNIQLTTTQTSDLAKLQAAGNSTVIVVLDQQVVSLIGIADEIRDGVADSLLALKHQGIKKLVMLTGDNEQTAQVVGSTLGLDEVHAHLLPEDKVTYVEALQQAGHRVAFIGDGINDSPSIARADIGISMGSGTDVAMETSDIVLMQSSFLELLHGYGLAKKTVLNTRENIFIAIAVVAFLLLGLIAGFIYMASGMFIHEASILVVIFNAMRLIRYNPFKQTIKSVKQVPATSEI